MEKDKVAAAPAPKEPGLHENKLAARKAELEAEMKRLAALEAKTVPGAPVLMPKARLLDTRQVEAKHPEYRYRWGALQNPDKMAVRKDEGYEVVPESEGGRTLGGQAVLLRIPREEYERRVKEIDRVGKARLEAHKVEFQRVVEGVARELRDKYGLKETTLERLLKE